MDMTRLRYELLAMIGCLFDNLLRSNVLIRIRNWYRRHKKEIRKDILVTLATIFFVLVTLSGREHKTTYDPEEASECTSVEEIETVVPEPKPELLKAQISDPYKAEAEEVARVLYGTARLNSEEDQRAVVWCIINRCESSLYPNTIEEVCKQPSQWMGYSEKNPIIKDLYEIANEELTTWHNDGYRTVSPDFLFLSWSQNEIVLRTSFTESSACRYWKAK